MSTGDLLRQHVREQTKLGVQAKQYMNEGKLVPDSLMIDLVMTDATPYLEEGRSLLLDGFPRTINQAQALDQVVNVDLVINLDVPTETIVERIADRYVQPEVVSLAVRCTVAHVRAGCPSKDGSILRLAVFIPTRTSPRKCRVSTMRRESG